MVTFSLASVKQFTIFARDFVDTPLAKFWDKVLSRREIKFTNRVKDNLKGKPFKKIGTFNVPTKVLAFAQKKGYVNIIIQISK